MLEELSIKDFALIDNATVEFDKGFTVLSGETGAGKSLLIGALTFLLGGKSGADLIRQGAHEASVTGTFYIERALSKGGASRASATSDTEPVEVSDDSEYEPKNAFEWLSLHGISIEDDRVLLRRYVRENGKSGAYIGDTPVTRNDLASFSAFLVDIHGQHEHQSLMRVAEHRKFLDSYAEINEEVENFTSLYSSLVAKRKKLADLNTNEADREKKIELLSFAVEEIAEAKLKANEDEELADEENRLSSFEKLFSEMETINGTLDEAVSSIKRIRGAADTVSGIDKTLSSFGERLENAFFEISDIAGEYRSYTQSLAFDPERLAAVQDRLALIFNLKKKYASTVQSPLSEVLKYAEDAKAQLDALSQGAEGKEALKKEIAELEKNVYMAAKAISAKRKAASVKMAGEVASVLSNLGMKGTKFVVSVKDKVSSESGQQILGPYGMDDIEFLISANAGLPLGALDKIASGGELSRVMLALKTVLSKSDTVSTLIFDEIDTGIGGEVAISVGSHIKNLAETKQILCITHLASIASFADNQVKIEKSVSGGLTHTSVFRIEGDERVREIARMLSGDAETETSLAHARQLLEQHGN